MRNMTIACALINLSLPAVWFSVTTLGWTGDRFSSYSLPFAIASLFIAVISCLVVKRESKGFGWGCRWAPWLVAPAPALMLIGLAAFLLPGEGGYWGAWLYMAGMAVHLLAALLLLVYTAQGRKAFS